MKIVYTSSVSSHGKFFFLFAMLTKALHQKIHVAYVGCLNGFHLQVFPFLAPFSLRYRSYTFLFQSAEYSKQPSRNNQSN